MVLFLVFTRSRIFSSLRLPLVHYLSYLSEIYMVINRPFFFLMVIMMSWFCSRLISFPSICLILQPDMVKYLRSQGSSREARGLGDRTALGCRWTTLSRCWMADRWWLVRICFTYTFCREDSVVPNVRKLIFYTHVSPALIHFWILRAKERCCLMGTYLPERMVTMAWVQNGRELWKWLEHGRVDKALLMWQQ